MDILARIFFSFTCRTFRIRSSSFMPSMKRVLMKESSNSACRFCWMMVLRYMYLNVPLLQCTTSIISTPKNSTSLSYSLSSSPNSDSNRRFSASFCSLLLLLSWLFFSPPGLAVVFTVLLLFLFSVSLAPPSCSLSSPPPTLPFRLCSDAS